MTILISTRDEALGALLQQALERAGWPCAAATPEELPERAPLASALVVDVGGDAPLPECALGPGVPVIALVPDAAASFSALPRATRFIVRKPFTQRALERALGAALPSRAPRRERPLAVDPAMRALGARLEALASTSLCVVISGEAGTGKTHWARWLHARSPRALGPLLEVACGTLAPGELGLEGAPHGEPGPLERAHGGTLLLEEVAELPRGEQLALLRFLIERTSAQGVPLDVRVVATTRHGLARDAAEGRVHPDLAARLAAAEVAIPPLRARPLELAPFARTLAERAACAAGSAPPLLDEATLEALRDLDWPGNLHQLENLMSRAALLAPGRRVDLAALAGGGGRGPARLARESIATLDLRELEREAIERALAASDGDRALAARALGIHVRTLRNKLRDRAS